MNQINNRQLINRQYGNQQPFEQNLSDYETRLATQIHWVMNLNVVGQSQRSNVEENIDVRSIVLLVKHLLSQRHNDVDYFNQHAQRHPIISQYSANEENNVEYHDQYENLSPDSGKKIAQTCEFQMLKQHIEIGKDAEATGNVDSEEAKRGQEASNYLRNNQDKEHLQDLAKEMLGVYFVANKQTHQSTQTEKNQVSEKTHEKSEQNQKQIVEQSIKFIEQLHKMNDNKANAE